MGAATTTVLVTSSSSSTTPTLGDTLTFTATVVPPNSTTPAPTGSIQWTFTQSPASPSCANSSLSTIGGTNTASATCTVSAASVGTYTVSAAYPAQGTTGNYGTGSGTGTITVGKAASSTVVTETSSPSPAQPGSTLTFKATIGANPPVASDPEPTSTVVWSITGPAGTNPTCPNSQMTAPPGAMGSNTATCTVANAAVGTYTDTATYGGDGNYTAAPAASGSVTVNKATPTLSFTINPQNPQPGASFTVKATVNGTPGITPTGTLTWTVTPPSGAAPTCAVSTLDNTGSGTCTVANALLGSYTVSAAYSGNASYTAANGSTPVVVALAPAGFDIQGVPNNPADGKPDNGDQVVYTYNQTMSANSILAGWNGSSRSVTAQFSRQNGQSTALLICTSASCNTAVNLGMVSLGDPSGNRYLNGSSVTVNATMVMTTTAGRSVVTVTLTQTVFGLSALSPSSTTTTLVWTPSASATNPTGTACSTTPVTQSGTAEEELLTWPVIEPTGTRKERSSSWHSCS